MDSVDFSYGRAFLAPKSTASEIPNQAPGEDDVLTNKGKYGLKAMVHLAGLEPGALAQVADIAEANSISKKFLDHILTELRHAGLVYSKKGRGGGYGLARPAHEIRVGNIVRVLDGPLAPIQCASVTASGRARTAGTSGVAPSGRSWSRPATASPMCSTIGRWRNCGL